MNENEGSLNKNYLELTELRHIVSETAQFFQEVCVRACLAYIVYVPAGSTALVPAVSTALSYDCASRFYCSII